MFLSSRALLTPAVRKHRFSFYRARPFIKRWVAIRQSLGVFGHMSTGNTLQVYEKSEDAFRAMWADIDAAKTEVHWQTYICKDDVVGKLSMKRLEDAHSRGVETELLYDCGGNITGRTQLTERLRAMGGRVIRHRPFFAFLWTYLSSGMKWQFSPAIRNHRKILIVDRAVGYAGGLNIGDDYCGTPLGGNGRFRDTHCRVVGPAVLHLVEAYEDTKKPRAWAFSFARWRQILANAVQRQQRRPRVRYAIQRGESAMLHLRELSTRLSAQFHFLHDDKVKSPTTPGGSSAPQLRLRGGSPMPARWIRQQLHAANVATRRMGHRSGNAMRNRLTALKHRAASMLERQRELATLRSDTKKFLDTSLEDSAPVPESESIHGVIQPFTQILTSNPHSRDWSIQLAFWQVTKNVHRRIWITTPYYKPHRKLTRAIILAARRGVDVRIMAGSRTTTDPWFMWHASQYISARFLREGVRIFEYNGGQIMHAKTVVADSVWSCVGSYNWDSMSNKNMEVCVTHFETAVARELERHFLEDADVSVELKLDEFENRPWLRKVVAFCAYHTLQIVEKLTFFTYRDSDLSSNLD